MKKAWIVFLLLASNAYGVDVTKTKFNPFTGKPDFITNFASMSIGDLGIGIKIADEGTLQGGASWFNFVGAAVTVSVSGGTATVTINGGGGSDNFGSHVSTMVMTIPYGLTASSGVFVATLTVYDVIQGTSGAILGGSTITAVYFNPGVVGAPSISDSRNPRTGWYRSGTDIWAFSSNGAQTLNISGSALNMGSAKQINIDPGSETAPGLNYVTNTNGFWTAGSPADWHFSAAGPGTTAQTWYRNSKIQFGRLKTAGKMSAGVTVSTMVQNDPLFAIESATKTVVEVTGSSFTVTTDTVCFNSVCAQWSSTPVPTGGDYVLHFNNLNQGATFYLGGDASGTSGAGTPASLQSPATGIYNLRSDAGTRYGIANTTGIEVGNGLQLTTWMSTAVFPGVVMSTTTSIYHMNFDMASLHPLTTDFASVESTNMFKSANSLIPFLVRALDGATTEYAHGKFIVPSDIDLSSSVYFTMTVIPKTVIENKQVQFLFQSTATSGGGVYNYVLSTGIDNCMLSASTSQITTCQWSQTVSALDWHQNETVFFRVGRGHDTSKLTSNELLGDLYALNLMVDIPLVQKENVGGDNLGNGKASSFLNAGGAYAIGNSTGFTIGDESIFYSTQSVHLLDGYVMAVGSFTALPTGGTLVVAAPTGFSAIQFPMVSEIATDAEANQTNISAITATTFTIKNKSALNVKSGVWSCFLKR